MAKKPKEVNKMKIHLISANTEKRLAQIEKLYMEAFPKEERKPFSLIIDKSEKGYVDILSIETEEEHMMGEAIIAKDKGIALLDYFAIFSKFRSSGIGSQSLKLLQNRYDNQKFILEIESTLHPVSDLPQRMKRKDFYLKNDMCCMDYLTSLFGIEMEIMTYDCIVTFEEYHALYENIFGSRMAEQIKLI